MLPNANSSIICTFRPAVFRTDENEGVVNCKMQIIGLGTRSREEGRNLKVHFNFHQRMIYDLVLHSQLIFKFRFEESLGIYQTYFLKQKDFHSSNKGGPSKNNSDDNLWVCCIFGVFFFLLLVKVEDK